MRHVLLSSMICALAVPAMAAPARHVLTEAQVAAAMNGAGMQIKPSQVTLFSDVVTTSTDPQLTVRSIEPQNDQRAIARLECADHAECLPFVVAIQLEKPGAAAGAAPAMLHSAAYSAPVVVSAQPLVHPGSNAVLLLDSGPVHITVPVICLERGSAGETIRVSDRQRRIFYRAQVVSGNLLKGSF